MNQHIYLTGYRGTGKTSVGRILAQRLAMPLVDLDDEIEIKADKSIREIFQEGGESAFRDLETTCLDEVSQRVCTVIALGGGAVLRPQNRVVIAQTGVCVWLTASAESLLARLQDDQTTAVRRPALTGLPQLDEIRQLLADREPIYRDSADHRVDTEGKSIEAVADEILDALAEH